MLTEIITPRDVFGFSWGSWTTASDDRRMPTLDR